MKMKQLILAAALAALGGAAFAGSSTTTVNIGGEVGASCAAAIDPLNLGQIDPLQGDMGDNLQGRGFPATINMTINCSNGTPFSVQGQGGAVAYISGITVWLIEDSRGSGTTVNGTPFYTSFASTGTGMDQSFAIGGYAFRMAQGIGFPRPTGGIVSGVLPGAFTINY